MKKTKVMCKNINRTLPHTLQTQRGFSIVELMVAMLISLFLIAGVVSVYLSTTESSRVSRGLRTMQENARFAFSTLRNNLQMAGYIDDYDPTIIVTPFDTTATSDSSVKITYEGILDCTGTAVAAIPPSTRPMVTNAFSLNGGALICQGNTAATETIVPGVDQMRVLYGLDDDEDKIADRYVQAATVTADDPNNWQENVVSLRIGLLLNSVENIKPNAEQETHQLLDIQITTNDRRMHRVFTNTIILRNRLI